MRLRPGRIWTTPAIAGHHDPILGIELHAFLLKQVALQQAAGANPAFTIDDALPGDRIDPIAGDGAKRITDDARLASTTNNQSNITIAAHKATRDLLNHQIDALIELKWFCTHGSLL